MLRRRHRAPVVGLGVESLWPSQFSQARNQYCKGPMGAKGAPPPDLCSLIWYRVLPLNRAEDATFLDAQTGQLCSLASACNLPPDPFVPAECCNCPESFCVKVAKSRFRDEPACFRLEILYRPDRNYRYKRRHVVGGSGFSGHSSPL